jgi:hypothetical protein
MARWRAAAIERLPEFREIIAKAETIMQLWIELKNEFRNAYLEPRNDDLIGRIYSFAEWSWQAPRLEDAVHDPSTGATVAFLEHIPSIPAARDDMPRWLTFDEVVANKQLFTTWGGLTEIEFKELLAYMQRNRHRYIGPPKFPH